MEGKGKDRQEFRRSKTEAINPLGSASQSDRQGGKEHWRASGRRRKGKRASSLLQSNAASVSGTYQPGMLLAYLPWPTDRNETKRNEARSLVDDGRRRRRWHDPLSFSLFLYRCLALVAQRPLLSRATETESYSYAYIARSCHEAGS